MSFRSSDPDGSIARLEDRHVAFFVHGHAIASCYFVAQSAVAGGTGIDLHTCVAIRRPYGRMIDHLSPFIDVKGVACLLCRIGIGVAVLYSGGDSSLARRYDRDLTRSRIDRGYIRVARRVGHSAVAIDSQRVGKRRVIGGFVDLRCTIADAGVTFSDSKGITRRV